MRPLRHVGTWLPPLGAAAALVGVWQLVAVHEGGEVVASVPATLDFVGAHPGELWRATLVTVQEVAVGASASLLVAFALAVVMVHARVVERAVMPLAVVVNVTPVIAYAPGLALLLGFGLAPRYVVTAVIAFFPFLVNSLVGLRSVDQGALEVLRSLDASRFEILVRLRIPSSLPLLFAAARVCLPLAVVGAVVAEFTTSGSAGGLGSMIASGNQSLLVPEIYAAILVLAALGVALTLAVVLVERRLVSWHSSSTRPL